MSEFAFAKSQLVTLPAGVRGEGVQGTVSARQDFINKPNQYEVHFLFADLSRSHIVIDEADLIAAQPPKMVTLAEAEKVAEEARLAVTAELGNDIAGLRQRIDRMVRNAKRKRAKAKKPTRNRRRR